MLNTTKDLVRAALKADGTIDQTERAAMLARLTLPDAAADNSPLILRPREAARILSVTTRTLGNLRKRGELAPVRLPGRARALGYRAADVRALAGA